MIDITLGFSVDTLLKHPSILKNTPEKKPEPLALKLAVEPDKSTSHNNASPASKPGHPALGYVQLISTPTFQSVCPEVVIPCTDEPAIELYKKEQRRRFRADMKRRWNESYSAYMDYMEKTIDPKLRELFQTWVSNSPAIQWNKDTGSEEISVTAEDVYKSLEKPQETLPRRPSEPYYPYDFKREYECKFVSDPADVYPTATILNNISDATFETMLKKPNHPGRFKFNDDFTFSAWSSPNMDYQQLNVSLSGNTRVSVGVDGVMQFRQDDGSIVSGKTNVLNGEHNYMVWVYKKGAIQMFVNGRAEETTTSSTIYARNFVQADEKQHEVMTLGEWTK